MPDPGVRNMPSNNTKKKGRANVHKTVQRATSSTLDKIGRSMTGGNSQLVSGTYIGRDSDGNAVYRVGIRTLGGGISYSTIAWTGTRAVKPVVGRIDEPNFDGGGNNRNESSLNLARQKALGALGKHTNKMTSADFDAHRS